MKRSDLTGSVASVSSKNVEGFKTSSVVEALGGQVAGVQITQADGTPGAGFSINIRGYRYHDGRCFTSLYSRWFSGKRHQLPGQLGHRIDRGAQRCIVGSDLWCAGSEWCGDGNKPNRANRDVPLLATTDRPATVPSLRHWICSIRMSLRNYKWRSTRASMLRLTTVRAKMRMGIPYRYQTLDDYIGVEGVDWQSETFRPTWSQDHNLSVSGGNENTKYSIALSRYDENGMLQQQRI